MKGKEIVTSSSRIVSKPWVVDQCPQLRLNRAGALVFTKKRKRRKRTPKPRVGLQNASRINGWNRWKKPFLQRFATMHMRVAETAGMAYGRGVIGPFGKILGDPTAGK